ncbi:hypothetical protein F383_07963 [Gossypium arboreum]|uniref:Uncharacterized protein n=1 Tax=Gossypium arboreum TaxID=29729 RepID=A0A0B0PQ18_GOSAR|nr:hypothetical protein F383_07963 [Gossypium arboreum]
MSSRVLGYAKPVGYIDLYHAAKSHTRCVLGHAKPVGHTDLYHTAKSHARV